MNSTNADVYYFLGLTLFSMEKKEEAIENYKNAILIDPNHATAYASLGAVLFTLG